MNIADKAAIDKAAIDKAAIDKAVIVADKTASTFVDYFSKCLRIWFCFALRWRRLETLPNVEVK